MNLIDDQKYKKIFIIAMIVETRLVARIISLAVDDWQS
jgi:hypothetical protein